jgi:hypothetical protein
MQKDDGKGGEGIEGKWKPEMEMEMENGHSLSSRNKDETFTCIF